jgi:hypothetical protein
MSSMNVYLSENKILIATDTYCHKKENEKEQPINFVSKVFYLPQHKTVFACQGLAEFGLSFFAFVQRKAVASDLSSLLFYTKCFFNKNYLPPELRHLNPGTLFFFGLNDKSNKLECHKLLFDENSQLQLTYIPAPNVIRKPDIDNFEERWNSLYWNDLDAQCTSLVQLTIWQKEDDSLLEEDKKIGIGGEVQLTILEKTDDTFYIETQNIFRFPDYEELIQKMRDV